MTRARNSEGCFGLFLFQILDLEAKYEKIMNTYLRKMHKWDKIVSVCGDLCQKVVESGRLCCLLENIITQLMLREG